jgi:hypothetical protein
MTEHDQLEARLDRDEARLAFDEARLDAESEEIRESSLIAKTGIAFAVILAIAVTALVLSVVALRRDVATLSGAAPEGSVSTASLQDGTITSSKLFPGAVGGDAIAKGAVGSLQLAAAAVTGEHVAADTLTGAHVRESSLAAVPTAKRARDSARLGGHPSGVYVSGVVTVEATTLRDRQTAKGPLVARCPPGTRVLSGGAAIRGAARGVGIPASTPDGDAAWTATGASRDAHRAWRLVVTATCAAGGR